jgi:hypothetical protein
VLKILQVGAKQILPKGSAEQHMVCLLTPSLSLREQKRINRISVECAEIKPFQA